MGRLVLLRDITPRRVAQRALEGATRKLKHQKEVLERKTVALQEVLAQVESEKQSLKQQIQSNFEKILLPYLWSLKSRADASWGPELDLLENLLQESTSSFGVKIAAPGAKLTPREVEICTLIKGGLRSKDIADRLSLSLRTVGNHRDSIRRKLCLTGGRENLASYLRAID